MATITPHRIGLYLAALQFFFTLTWTVYVIFLPRLAAQVGIRPQAVILILMLDQVIFAVTDWAMGMMADRVSRVLGRLSLVVALVTAVSCLAFLLLPYVAASGSEALFLAVVIVWSVTSSVLRAPPLALLGKYAAQPAVPWLASLALFGLGVAGAVSPYLTVALREADPRLPFALASVALLAVTLGLGWVERNLAGAGTVPAAAAKAPPREPLGTFLLAVALLGLGFQIHFALNAAPLFLKFAKPAELEYLMPVFWIGFNLLMLPGTLLTSRYGGLAVMAAAGVIGGIASYAALHADSLAALTIAQFVAGGAWGCVLMSAVSAALALGHTGREGSITGALFSLLALATLARMAIVWGQVNKDPSFAAIQPWLPAAVWIAAGALLLLVARIRLRTGSQGAAA
jgi:hypothetical protein